MAEEVKEQESEKEAEIQSATNPGKKCTGVRPICHDGKPAVCNTSTGLYECPGIIA